jgi:hypothetical protein
MYMRFIEGLVAPSVVLAGAFYAFEKYSCGGRYSWVTLLDLSYCCLLVCVGTSIVDISVDFIGTAGSLF